jgi:hypothetical protein
VTSENLQIQALLQQINEVLDKTNPRLPWVMSSDAAQQRQVLEQTRQYLLSLQQNGTPEATQAEPSTLTNVQSSAQSAAAMEASAQQVLQAVVQEMNYLRSNMMQPLRSDIEMLRIQRDALSQEIRQLEMQRQQYGLPQQNPQYLTEFLQAAMNQMQANLAGQVAQMLATPQTPMNSDQLAGRQPTGLLEGGPAAGLSPAERLQRLQLLQSQSDQLMLRLDTTLRTVFESLQHNLQSYQDSLEEGLGRMHDMGRQGEAVFGAFITRLGQILGREVSSFLQSPPTRSDRPSLPGQKSGTSADREAQIHRLLEELSAIDQTALNRSVPGEPVPFEAPAPSGLTSEAELENLRELDRVLSQLDLSAMPDPDALDEDLVLLEEEEQSFAVPHPDAATGYQPQQPSMRRIETDPDRVDWKTEPGDPDEDLESAIDLLNQIAAEIPINPHYETVEFSRAEEVAPAPAPLPDSALVEHPDALYQDAELNQTLSSQAEDAVGGEGLEAPAEAPATETTSSPATDRPDADLSEASAQFQNEELVQVDAVTELDAGLFAGLVGIEASPLPSPPPIAPADLAQSAENQLLRPSEPARSPQAVTLDAFFGEVENAEENADDSQEEGEGEASGEAAIETIAALTDLIPPASSEASNSEASPFFVEPPRLLDFTDSNEATGASQPSLPSEGVGGEMSSDLPPETDTLQQLSADWFNLEDTSSSSTFERSDRTDWTLGDWQDSSSVEPVQPAEGIEWSIADIPSVLLSQPFSGQMTAEDLLFADEFLGGVPSNSSAPEFERSIHEHSESLSVAETAAETVPPAAPTDAVSHDTARNDAARNDAARTDLLESTLEDWFSAVDSGPAVMPEAEEDLNAFTLDGLDSLFEGVPSIDAEEPDVENPSIAPPAAATDTQAVTVDTLFDQGQEADSESSDFEDDRQQKKKFGFSESDD